jgi:hypothetical protein
MGFDVQCSNNLADWTPLGTVTNLDGTLNCDHPDKASNPQRFYRAKTK